MWIRLLRTASFSQGIFLMDAHRVKSFGSYVLCVWGKENISPSLHINLAGITLDLGSSVDFCIAALKMLSPEYKPVELVSHFFHSLFACVIPLTYT